MYRISQSSEQAASTSEQFLASAEETKGFIGPNSKIYAKNFS